MSYYPQQQQQQAPPPFVLYVTNDRGDVAGQSAMLWVDKINAIAPGTVHVVRIESILTAQLPTYAALRQAHPWLKGSPTLVINDPMRRNYMYGSEALECLINVKGQKELSLQTAPGLQSSGSGTMPGMSAEAMQAAGMMQVPGSASGARDQIDFRNLGPLGSSSGADARFAKAEAQQQFEAMTNAYRTMLPAPTD
jgi:hypothetical protein